MSNTIPLSKFLSFVLRHRPDTIGLRLDDGGWTTIDELISRSTAAGTAFTRDELLHVVATNDKKRFSLSADGERIRAAQGHSVDVDLGLVPRVPPDTLYHGTAERFLESIRTTGLQPRSRRHVHLSATQETAFTVGKRHGSPVVLTIDTQRMHAAGGQFFLTENGVWLTSLVPPEFILRT